MLDSAWALCPRFEEAFALLGKRWTGVIIETLLAGRCRFSDILSAVPHLSDRMLSERLRELEQAGIVERCVYPESPVRIEYHLTEKGKGLAPVMEAVHQWADQWIDPTESCNPS